MFSRQVYSFPAVKFEISAELCVVVVIRKGLLFRGARSIVFNCPVREKGDKIPRSQLLFDARIDIAFFVQRVS